MLFNSLGFMFVFLPLCFGLYFLLGYKANFSLAKFSLAVFSLIFYAWWDWRYLGLLLFSILFNYTSATLMLGAKKYKKLILIFALCVNIALLCYFKYMDFFIENLNWIGGLDLPLLHIVLPLGISFFTITQIAFLIDCYEGLVKEKSLSNYILFVTFFPHLIAGPILHHKQMMPQFANKENEKWGFTDKNGNTVVEAKYDKVTEFNEYGFAGVRLDGKWGVVNSKGEEVIAPTYVLNEEIEPYFIGKYYRVQYGLGEFYYTDLNDTTEDTINE